MTKQVESVAVGLAQMTRRRALVAISRIAASAVVVVGGVLTRTQPALAGGCPNCKGLPPCSGCYFSRCPSGCSWVWSWTCCFNGCIYECSDCDCDGNGTRDCICAGNFGAAAPVQNKPQSAFAPCFVC